MSLPQMAQSMADELRSPNPTAAVQAHHETSNPIADLGAHFFVT